MSHKITVAWHQPDIALINFSDAARMNQFCWAAIDEFAAVLQDCRQQGARVLVLASDLKGHWYEHAWLQDLSDGVAGNATTGEGSGWFTALQELTEETTISIAAISGDCSGGGAELGWACDLRIAESGARFAQPEIHMGLTTGIGGCSRLARLAGRGVAAEMVLGGGAVSARRLYQLGAVNRVVAEGAARDAALEFARQLAGKSPSALRGLKKILLATDRLPLDQALDHEQEVFLSVVVGEDASRAMQAVQQQYDNGVTMAELYEYEPGDDQARMTVD